MSYEFRLQDPGEGIHEAEILEVSVKVGDQVAEGDDVLVAETDKAAVDIPSPVDGKVKEIKVSEGDVVKVGDVLVIFGQDGDEDSDASAQSDDDKAPDADENADAADEREDKAKHPDETDDDTKDQADDQEAGSEDHETSEGSDDDRAAKSDESQQDETDAEGVLATPAVRGLARELDVDIERLTGNGAQGRIVEDDVRRAADEPATETDKPAADRREADAEPAAKREKLRSIRRATARRMAQAWRDIPHVTHYDDADITELERLRREQGADLDEGGVQLSLSAFLVKALANALRAHPRFNATFDPDKDELEIKPDVHIGVATDTERGLVVPVLRDADEKSVVELAEELGALTKTLREERPSGDMLKGGTFTLTNVGPLGGTGLSPLINPPQVAIFGAARAELRQVVRGDLDDHALAVALMLPVCVTFDHRVLDGADAARFMNTVTELLSDPAEFLIRS